MSTEVRSLVFSLVLALLLTGGALALLWAGGNDPPPALAQGPDGYDVYYVSLDGNCGGEIPCYTTVQAAVDAVDDPADEVWVATGTYTGVNGYGGLSQMVYISKSLTLRGGYSTDFSAWDPDTYTTTLDAESSGRALYVTGAITPVIEGLDLTHGKLTSSGDDGAGIYVSGATVVISGCRVHHNVIDHNYASYDYGAGLALVDTHGSTVRNSHIYENGNADTLVGGGGIYVDRCNHCLLEGNEIYDNYAHRGGGVNIDETDLITVRDNAIYNNVANRPGSDNEWGGGLAVSSNAQHLTLENNLIYGNDTDLGTGGGAWLYGKYMTIADNDFHDNSAVQGGGMYLYDNSTSQMVTGNRFYSNTASSRGGGAFFHIRSQTHPTNVMVTNNLFYSNTATWRGGGVSIKNDKGSYDYPQSTWINNALFSNIVSSGSRGSDIAFYTHSSWTDYPFVAHLLHTTLGGNSDGDSGVYVGGIGTVQFTNTIIYSYSVGVRRDGGTVSMTHTLWQSSTTRVDGTVSEIDSFTGTVAFAADGYHLTSASDAIDHPSSDTGAKEDIDGQPRRMGDWPDLGADEYAFTADLALTKTGPISGTAGEVLTYTLTVTNAAASEVDADARVVDAVEPAAAVADLSASTSGGDCTTSSAVVTCTLYNIATGTQRTVTVRVTPTATYDGVLTNTATVTPANAVDSNGLDNADAVTTTVVYVAPVVDPWVEKEVSAQYAEPGDTLIYTITWGNNGTGTAYTTTLTDTLPTGVGLQSADPAPDSTDPLVWDLGDVTAGTSETYVITATVNTGLSDGTELTNHALIAAPTLSDTASATTTVYALGGYDLAMQKELLSSGPYDYGDQIHYRITISNTGQLAADVTLNDAIPAGTEYVEGSASAGGVGTLDDSDGIEWTGTLDVGDAQVIEFKVEIISAEGVKCGLISNQASASIAGTGYTWLATADVNVRSPDLTVDVAPQEHAAKNDHGEFAPYTATVTYENKNDHDHPGPAYSTTLTVTLPSANAAFVSSDPKPDTKVNDRTWVWNLGTVNAGANDSLNLTIQPDTPGNGEYRLAAKIAGLPEECCDPNAANYDEAWTYRVDMDFQKETQATKWTWATDPQSGQASGRYEQEYYLDFHYQNTNPDRPNLVTYSVTDTLPSQLTFDSAVAQPAMDVHQVDDQTMVWRMLADDPFRVGDRAWIRLKGESGALEAGAVLTNQAHLAYALSAQEQFTNSALVTNTAPLFPPLITYPGNGEICGNEFGRVEMRGQAQPNAKVVLYVDNDGSGFYTDTDTIADANGVFTITTLSTLPDYLEWMKLYARACAPDDPGQCSQASNQVEVLESQSNWCPQRSYWEGTVKDGALEGEEMTFRFRDSDGYFSTFSWQMPGVYGFWDTDLHLYSCCNEQTQAMTVTADGEVYAPASRDGHWYHFDITGGAHEVTIQSQCGDETNTSSGEILIDPDGYVFNVDKGGDYDPTMGGSFNPVESISGVTVTCMMSAPEWGGWVPWPAHLYEDQVNPQVTDAMYPDGITTTGYYAFFTPPGHYYLQVEGIPSTGSGQAPAYQAWRSPVVEVITQIVHVNVPYTPWVSDTDVYSVTVMPAPIEVGDGTLWAGVQLDPAVITVPVGSVVEWTSALSETNTVDDLITWSENPIFQVLSERDPLQDTRGFDSGYLEPGRVYRRAFASPGVYTYTVYGRSGRVIVTDERAKIYLPVVLRD